MQTGVAFLAFLLIGANDGAFGVLLPSLAVHYQITNATVSLLLLANAAGYLLAALNTGFLMSRLGVQVFLLVGFAFLGICMGALLFMPPFFVVLCLFIPIGFGIAVLDSGLNAYMAGLPQNTTLLNYLHACYGTGALLGPLLASTLLVLGFTWGTVYLVLALICVLLFVSVTVVFRETTGATRSRGTTPEVSRRGAFVGNLFRLRSIWPVALFLFMYVGIEHSLGSWSYSFLTEQRRVPAFFSGWIISGYWLGLTLGRIIFAQVARRVAKERLLLLCLPGVFCGALLGWLCPLQLLSAFGLCLLGFSLGPIFPTTLALTSSLVSERLLASAVGFLTSLTCIGAAFFPWLIGTIMQRLTLEALFPFILLLSLGMLGTALALQGKKTRMAGS